jgi:hypothetical protein
LVRLQALRLELNYHTPDMLRAVVRQYRAVHQKIEQRLDNVVEVALPVLGTRE